MLFDLKILLLFSGQKTRLTQVPFTPKVTALSKKWQKTSNAR
jgi:hypothetical protein